jgi:hypothetical protein
VFECGRRIWTVAKVPQYLPKQREKNLAQRPCMPWVRIERATSTYTQCDVTIKLLQMRTIRYRGFASIFELQICGQLSRHSVEPRQQSEPVAGCKSPSLLVLLISCLGSNDRKILVGSVLHPPTKEGKKVSFLHLSWLGLKSNEGRLLKYN